MKKIYLFFIVLLTVCASLKGQVAVTATGGAFSGSYPTLKAAFDAINNGDHQGAINIRINASITETATARLNANGGTAHYSRIHIRPNVACTISGNIAGPLIELNGADSVTFEGRIGGVGTERSLTIRNLYAASNNFGNTTTIRLCNNASGNKLRYLNIEGAGQGENAGTVFIGYGSNLYNVIENNEIGPAAGNLPCLGIHVKQDKSVFAAINRYTVITNNLIHDFSSTANYSGGILLQDGTWNSTIAGNSIYYTLPLSDRQGRVTSCISIHYGKGDTIRNNFIGGSAPYAGGSPALLNDGSASIVGISAGSNEVDTFVIEGNVIKNFKLSSSVQDRNVVFQGINAGSISAAKVIGNTIGSLDKADDITIAYTGSTPSPEVWMVGIYADGGSRLGSIITDNSVGGLTVNGANAENAFLNGLLISTNSNTLVERNTVGGQVPGSIQLNTSSGTVDGIKMIFQGTSGYQYTCRQNLVRHLYNNCSGTTDAIVRGIYSFLQQTDNTKATAYITGNRITHLHNTASSALNGTVQGIYGNIGPYVTRSFVNSRISGNTIDTLSSETNGYASVVMGIGSLCPHDLFLDIDSNTIHTLRNAAANTNAVSSAAVQGISTNPPYLAPVTITGNRIYDLESTTTVASTVIGINSAHKSNMYPYILSKNQVYDLRNGQSEGGSVIGVSLRGGSGTGTFIVTNNMISLNPERVTVYGITHTATATGMKLYYNTIAIGGTASGSTYSGGFYRTWGVNTNISSLNNIFHNTRKGGNGRHYALRNDHPYPTTGWTNSNYNDLYALNPKALVSWRVVSLSLAQYRDSSGQDLASKSMHVDFADSLAGDLHLLQTDSNRLLTGIAIDDVKDDFDGDPRHDHPAIGADEIEVLTPLLARSMQAFSHPAPNNSDDDKKTLLLYPNPTPDVLRINITGYDEKMILTIFDMSGKERMTQQLQVSNPGSPVIDVQRLTPGNYLLQLTTSKGIITKRFVKM